MDIKNVFESLSEELASRGLFRELTICGGAALIALNIIGRETKDVDVLIPKIDADLNLAAEKVAVKLKLNNRWLNNGPAMLVHELPHDWKEKLEVIYKSENLIVKSIGRRDLIYSKLYAAADRIDDIEDLVSLRPTEEELKEAKELVLKQDASDIWHKIVDECVNNLKKRLGHVR